jgi:hypothetical protein
LILFLDSIAIGILVMAFVYRNSIVSYCYRYRYRYHRLCQPASTLEDTLSSFYRKAGKYASWKLIRNAIIRDFVTHARNIRIRITKRRCTIHYFCSERSLTDVTCRPVGLGVCDAQATKSPPHVSMMQGRSVSE